MHILLLEVELHIHHAQSLKDKRSVVKSLLERLRNRFNVAAAETGCHDMWQRAEIAVVTLSTSARRAERIIEGILSEIEARGSADIIGVNQQWL